MNKKIMFLCGYQSLYSGNFIASLMELENELNRQGSNCIYVFPKDAANRPWYKELGNRGKILMTIDFTKSKLEMAKRVASIVKEYDVDILHTHLCDVIAIELFSLLYKNKRVNVVIHIHSDFSCGKESIKIIVKDFIKYRLLACKCKFISVSSYIVRKNKKKIVFVPNALATNRLFANDGTREEIRKAFSIKDEQILCMVYGWEPKVKGVDIAVKAICECNKNNKDKYVLGIVCGREVTKNKMKEFISKNTSLSGDEKYLIYFEPREDVFSYHRATDLLLSTSRSEGFSYTILEMLSLGKKCVISDIPGVLWSHKYENSTVFFESENGKDCAQKILEVGDNKNLIDEETANQIKEDYKISIWADRIIEEYKA